MFKFIKARRAAKLEARRIYDIVHAETMKRFMSGTNPAASYKVVRQGVEMEIGVAVGMHRS